ncbi:MAG: hypothetical protein WC197_06395 [Candidatus Gastranaerophilaceae bacterium]
MKNRLFILSFALLLIISLGFIFTNAVYAEPCGITKNVAHKQDCCTHCKDCADCTKCCKNDCKVCCKDCKNCKTDKHNNCDQCNKK